jgi:hypothetical protein
VIYFSILNIEFTWPLFDKIAKNKQLESRITTGFTADSYHIAAKLLLLSLRYFKPAPTQLQIYK